MCMMKKSDMEECDVCSKTQSQDTVNWCTNEGSTDDTSLLRRTLAKGPVVITDVKWDQEV